MTTEPTDSGTYLGAEAPSQALRMSCKNCKEYRMVSENVKHQSVELEGEIARLLKYGV